MDTKFGKLCNEDILFLTDGTLNTEDGWSSEVHKILLAKNSWYFRTLFCKTSKNRKSYVIPQIKGTILNQILYFLYTGDISLDDKNIYELMIASDYLIIDCVIPGIQEYAVQNLSVENCIFYYTISVISNYKEINKSSRRLLQTNFESLIYNNAAGFEEISLECLKEFLVDNNLCVRDERVVWLAIVKWVLGEESNRLHVVPDIVKYLRIDGVDASLANEIIYHPIVSKNPFCETLRSNDFHYQSSGGLDVLTKYLSEHSGIWPASETHNHRRPNHLHLVIRYRTYNNEDGVDLYITYDENIDLWRHLLTEDETNSTYFAVIGSDVYMIGSYSNCIKYNLLEKEWRPLTDFGFFLDLMDYVIVTINERIYVLGDEIDEQRVEFYDTWTDQVFEAARMEPISSFAATTYENRIFVVGQIPPDIGSMMVAQLYIQEIDEWFLFASPYIYRNNFAFVEYHRKLYIIGGFDGVENINKVEVYDFQRNIWEVITDLPYSYESPGAIVLNEQLVAFELQNPRTGEKTPPVKWNETQEIWEPLDKSLPLKDLDIYDFLTIDDRDTINVLVRENRDPRAGFEKSPFN